jgi:hypothetical protein
MQTLEVTLLPGPLRVEAITETGDTVVVRARLAEHGAGCPECGHPATHVQSEYVRRLDDVPWAGRRVRLHVTIRRFRCATADCTRRIFAERLGPFAVPSAQRTVRAGTTLEAVAFALSGEAGARFASGLGQPTSPDNPAAADPPRPRASGPADPRLRRGRLRPAQAAAPRDGAGRPGAAPAQRPAPRTDGDARRRVVAAAPGDYGRQPRPGWGIRRRRPPGRAAGHPGGGSLPPAAQPRRRGAARAVPSRAARRSRAYARRSPLVDQSATRARRRTGADTGAAGRLPRHDPRRSRARAAQVGHRRPPPHGAAVPGVGRGYPSAAMPIATSASSPRMRAISASAGGRAAATRGHAGANSRGGAIPAHTARSRGAAAGRRWPRGWTACSPGSSRSSRPTGSSGWRASRRASWGTPSRSAPRSWGRACGWSSCWRPASSGWSTSTSAPRACPGRGGARRWPCSRSRRATGRCWLAFGVALGELLPLDARLQHLAGS